MPAVQSIGHYVVEGLLGEGAHGRVYRARSRHDGAAVALKTVPLPQAQRLQSLRREIRALMQLRHPGVARIVEWGMQAGQPWYAMELVDGVDLHTYCRRLWDPGARHAPAGTGAALRRPRVPVEALSAILDVFLRLCTPLAYLHGEGIVHRDLKPRNVLLRSTSGVGCRVSGAGAPQKAGTPGHRDTGTQGSRDQASGSGAYPTLDPRPPTPVIVDFGLATRFGREVLELGERTAGTLAYMAPEQMRGELLDARADLYAFGCLLYGVLTGRAVYETADELLDPDVAPRPPSRHVEGLPPGLDELCLQLLAKDPRRRIGHAQVAASALEALGARAGPEQQRAPAARPYLYRPALSGREGLLQELGGYLGQRIRAGEGCVVLLGGESGIGKTRLALEVAGGFQRHGLEVVVGECVPPGGGQIDGSEAGVGALGAFRRALVAVADRCLEHGEAEAERLLGARGCVLRQYEPALGGVAGQASLPEPVGLPPEESRRRLFRYLAETLCAYAQGRPLLLVLDDLQWADELSLGFLEHLLASGVLGRHPLLVLGTYRSEEASERLLRLRSGPGVLPIELGRLDEQAVAAIAADMLAVWPAPERFSRFLARQAGGNPFFVAEYLRTAVAVGLFVRDRSGGWVVELPDGAPDVAAEYEKLPLPASLRELVLRRLDGLGRVARQLVESAAILGRDVDETLLGPVSGLGGDRLLAGVHELLTRHVLEQPRAGRLRFAHDKLREVALGAISPRRRRALHRKAAALLEALPGCAEDAGCLARLALHWDEAGEPARARPHYLRAARQEAARYGYEEAERLYRAYLRLAPDGHVEAIDVRNELARDVLRQRRRMAECLEQHRAALEAARSLGLPEREMHSLVGLAAALHEVGRAAESAACIAEALELRGAVQDVHRQADLAATVAHLRAERGRLAEAQALYEQALALYRKAGDRTAEGRIIGNLAAIDLEQGDHALAEARFAEAVAIFRQTGHRAHEAVFLGNLAVALKMQGRVAPALELYEQALQIHRDTGNLRSEGITLGNLAMLHLTQGRLEPARELFEQALRVQREVGDRASEGWVLSNLATCARLGQDDLDLAERLAAEAEHLLRRADAGFHLGACLAERAHLALARGRPALALLDEIERLRDTIGGGPQSPLAQAAERVRRAQQALAAGRADALWRGECLEDLPAGLAPGTPPARSVRRA